VGGDAFAHGFHNLEVDAQQVITAHPRLTRDTSGNDAHICACDIGVVVGAFEATIELGGRA